MTWQTGIYLMQSALLSSLWLALPLLVAATVAGLLTGALQSAFGLQEPGIPVLPKLFAVGAALFFFGAWMISFSLDFWRSLWLQAPGLCR
jgi:flagellar biosynthetic protein FliQ